MYNKQLPAVMRRGAEGFAEMQRNGLAEHPQEDDEVQISPIGAASCFHAASHAANGSGSSCKSDISSLPSRDVPVAASCGVDFVFLDFF
jgi:hypothetical protein